MMICGADKSLRNKNNRLPVEEARVSFNEKFPDDILSILILYL